MTRQTTLFIIVLFVAAVVLVCSWTWWGHDQSWSFLINVGFLIFGVFVAIAAQCVVNDIGRSHLKKDLALLLHLEITDRLARCCFDFELPWQHYAAVSWPADAPEEIPMHVFRLRKFTPAPPVIYPAIAGQCSVLSREQIQTALQFYFRLAAVERDIENLASQYDSTPDAQIERSRLKLIAIRLKETLNPGLKAIQALQSSVPDHLALEAAAIESLDAGRPPKFRNTGKLRERVEALVASNKQ